MNRCLGISLRSLVVFCATYFCATVLLGRDYSLAVDSLCYSFEAKTVISSGKTAPFWLHNNTWDGVSDRPYSGTLSASLTKPLAPEPADFTFRRGQRLFDYGFGATLTGHFADKCRFVPEQYYATCRFWLLDLTIGARRERFTNEVDNPFTDINLSAGGLLFSSNARPMPRITFGISRYRSFPYTRGYLQLKAAMTHGWFIDNTIVQNVFLHHKYAGVRIGGDWLFAVSAEVHHVAQWGGVSPQYGKLGSGWKDFRNAFLAKQGGTPQAEQINVEGNHITSQQLALDIQGKGWKVRCYYQQINEDNPVHIFYKTMNRRDGLLGISMQQSRWSYINAAVIEVLNTTDQSGPVHDIDGIVFGGADNYFQNAIYSSGWTFYRRTIGTPLIASPLYNNASTPSAYRYQPANSRLFAVHGAIQGDIKGFFYTFKVTHVQNFDRQGSYRATRNTALALQVRHEVQFRTATSRLPITFGIDLAADIGNQFGNQYGVMLSAAYNGVLKVRKNK